MKSLATIGSTTDRVSLKKIGTLTKAMIPARTTREFPRAAMIISAKSRNGIDWITSDNRESTSSTIPPKNPLTAPSGTPAMTPTRTPMNAIEKSLRVAQSTREKMSIPLASVPNR